MDTRLKCLPCGYVSITPQGVILEVNDAFLEMGNYTRDNLISNHIESIMSVANKLLFHSYFYPFIQLNGYVDEIYLNLKGNTGADIPVLFNGKYCEQTELVDCIFVHMGKRIDYEQEIRNAKILLEEAYRQKNAALASMEQLHLELEQKQAELIKLNHKLETLSNTDGLTGIHNHRFFIEKLNEYVLQFKESSSPFSLLMLDIDYFKLVNDTRGHPVGDKVLIQLATLLTDFFPKGHIIARYGGEEFVVIMPFSNELDSFHSAELLRSTIETAKWDVDKITVSIGVATSNFHETATSILIKADKALYSSKENGRNKVTHATLK
ncbi:sensor domain-containing diguanylate cyclase [Psychrobacillus antarcticus]|uniref:sensor domain-containing diguanylate cyclase n=1 Tax=Psychrobacillus antarcticus TaxID=2879115 RepID=UPI002407E4AF|nr:sensor domain-containing diguanylate cyclase [Psychrobacillus antarcticus]